MGRMTARLYEAMDRDNLGLEEKKVARFKIIVERLFSWEGEGQHEIDAELMALGSDSLQQLGIGRVVDIEEITGHSTGEWEDTFKVDEE